jgi:hypothetical protein
MVEEEEEEEEEEDDDKNQDCLCQTYILQYQYQLKSDLRNQFAQILSAHVSITALP